MCHIFKTNDVNILFLPLLSPWDQFMLSFWFMNVPKLSWFLPFWLFLLSRASFLHAVTVLSGHLCGQPALYSSESWLSQQPGGVSLGDGRLPSLEEAQTLPIVML